MLEEEDREDCWDFDPEEAYEYTPCDCCCCTYSCGFDEEDCYE